MQQANMIRFLCADMIERAKSGHPGAAMGMADIICVLGTMLVHDPKQTKWLNRDRLIFSGGHASALLYVFLHLSGYDLSLNDLKNFRKLHSKTPGHPELHTPGVEIATGPLGQGVANAVGYAMAAKRAAHLLGAKLINHHIYCLCGDGDLQEGLSYEACSLASVHQLNKLILIYDSNDISIEGCTDLAFNEDVAKRFQAQNFFVQRVDGHDQEALKKAIKMAKASNKPNIIIAKTSIAKGALELEGSEASHGAPLGEDLIARAKKAAGFDPNISFYTDKSLYFDTKNSEEARLAWEAKLQNSPKKALLEELLNPNYEAINWPLYKENLATRDSNSLIINAISDALPGFLGGSADLGPSNKSLLLEKLDFPKGPNIHYGIREHAMAAINNAFARYGLFLPYSATFFIFSEYLKPAARMAALMRLQHFFIFTHDSIGVGEDGPTHQPIEQLSSFRAQPDTLCFRPANMDENIKAWQLALKLKAPSIFILSRQKLISVGSPLKGDFSKGAYLIKEVKDTKISLLSSGSELSLAYFVAKKLDELGLFTRVISMPCYELFAKQTLSYQKELLKGLVIGIEAASSNELYRFCDEVIALNCFGLSAKSEEVFDHFGLSLEKLEEKIEKIYRQRVF